MAPVCLQICHPQEKKELSSEQKKGLIRAYYDTALRHYQYEEYGKAISYWEEILKLDPGQVQPPKLIDLARKKLQEKTAGALETAENAYVGGKYKLALEKAKIVQEADPSNQEIRKFIAKLESVCSLFSDQTGGDKVSRLVRIAITNYLKPVGNRKTVINALTYASQIDPNNEAIKRFINNHLEKEMPDVLKAIEVIHGMTLIEQKLIAALNYIYDAKYDRAIIECNEVLELEPENVLALKRLGSAYYALNKVTDARRIWRKALQINPKDDELRQYLKQ